MNRRGARQVTKCIALLAVAMSAACTPKETDAPDASVEPSPNASILPAPLASGTHARAPRGHTDAGSRSTTAEGGVQAPTILRDDEPLPVDETTTKEVSGVELDAAFRWPDLPHPPQLPEAPPERLRRLRQLSTLSVRIEIAHAGRLRARFPGRGFAVSPAAELRARTDYYGSVLVWPGGLNYRTLIPGTLRALFEEGRADVTPLVPAKVGPLDGGRVLNQKTEGVRLETPIGTLTLQQAPNAVAGSGAQLLCRMLVELVAAEPDSDACTADLLPLSAEFEWAEGGRLTFEVLRMARSSNLLAETLTVPPTGATFRAGELPARPNEPILDADTVAQLRGRAPSGPASPPPASTPKVLTLTNHTDTGRYLLLDAIPLIWVPARSEASVFGVKPGRYMVGWRDFFATQVTSPVAATLPAHLVVGTENDAGKGL